MAGFATKIGRNQWRGILVNKTERIRNAGKQEFDPLVAPAFLPSSFSSLHRVMSEFCCNAD